MDYKTKLRMPAKGERFDGPDHVLLSGALRVDLADKRVQIDGVDLSLTPKVFELLVLLMSAPQRVHTREEIFERLWPQSVLLDANLTTTVSQLRKALSEPLRPHLRTVPKVGYSWDAEVQKIQRSIPSAETPLASDAPVIETADSGADASFAPSDGIPSVEVDSIATRGLPLAASPDFGPFLGNQDAVSGSGKPARHSRRLFMVATAMALALVAAFFGFRFRDAAAVRPVLLVEDAIVDLPVQQGEWRADTVRVAITQYLQASSELRVVTPRSPAAPAGKRKSADSGAQATHRLVVRLLPAGGNTGTLRVVATLHRRWRADKTWQIDVVSGGLIPASQQVADHVLAEFGFDQMRSQTRPIPRSVLADFEQGARAARRKNLEEARRSFEKAIAASPHFSLARTELATVLNQLGRYDLAAEQWRAAAASNGLGPEAAAKANAIALLLSGKTAEAARAFHRLAERYPDEPLHALSHIDALVRDGGPSLAQAEVAFAALDTSRWSTALQLRAALLDGRLRRAQGRVDAALLAYRRAHDLAVSDGDMLLQGEAMLQIGQIHRMRDESEQAQTAFVAAATAFRSAGSVLHADIAEFNAMLSIPGGASVKRAEALLALSDRMAKSGNERVAGQALDAAAADLLALGDVIRGQKVALQAESMLSDREVGLRVGPQLTLALADLQLGYPSAALRRLDGISNPPNSETDAGIVVIRLQAWIALGQPLRAQAALDEAKGRWRISPPGSLALRRVSCAEARLALIRHLTTAARAAVAICDDNGSRPSIDSLAVRSAFYIALGDEGAARISEDDWRTALHALPDGAVRTGYAVEFVTHLLETDDIEGAKKEVGLMSVDAEGMLPAPLAARHELNMATIAVAERRTSDARMALARADRLITEQSIALRREYRLLTIGSAKEPSPLAANALREEALAAGDIEMAAKAGGVVTPHESAITTLGHWWKRTTVLR